MSEKIFKGRIIQKHDVEANWLKAVNFIPKKGEMIIYDKDATHNYERLKIGDGSTLVNSLPFVTDSVTSVSNANHATTAGSATQDSKGNVIDTTYETKTDASLKLADAKDYTDAQIEKVLEGTVANATTAESSTKATQDASGNVIADTYETKTDASLKLADSKDYTDSQIEKLIESQIQPLLERIEELEAKLKTAVFVG